MEAGYDYLLLRGRLQRKFVKYTGTIVLVFGAMLLATGGAYYGYAAKARADLDDLNVTLSGALQDPFQEQIEPSMPPSDVEAVSSRAPEVVSGLNGSGDDGGSPLARESARELPIISAAAIRSRQLYPGDALIASSWSNPWSYEPPSFREELLLQGFTPIAFDQAPPPQGLSSATRLIIPSISVDSSVKELAILDMGGSRAYETPANTVGHIPETAEAGEVGSSWFFGHTESPTLGEGSVFFNLGKIPDKLRKGEDVFIITDNGQQQYLYRVTSSRVVHQNDMKVYDTGPATIHLVSCVPRLVYDYRLIISGELLAQKTKS